MKSKTGGSYAQGYQDAIARCEKYTAEKIEQALAGDMVASRARYYERGLREEIAQLKRGQEIFRRNREKERQCFIREADSLRAEIARLQAYIAKEIPS